MNTIREGFRREVETLMPVLHEAYQRVGRYQKSRTGRNETLLRGALAEVGVALAFFKGLVPRKKRPYFDAILEEGLSLSDRVIALDVAVGAMHIEFSVPRAYMHRESEELRTVLEQSRAVESDRQERLHGLAPDVLLNGIPASPGHATGKAAIVRRSSDYRKLPSGSIVVARMTRTDMMIGVERIAGIVTDIGGSLCHAAIVAREIGIPCVVGTEHATELVRARQLIAVDGTAGVVRATRHGKRTRTSREPQEVGQ
jgi:phosphohistidine swiveling domain-containing protein